MTINHIYNADSRSISEVLNCGEVVNTTITSPPYFDMKDYGSENQIGFGQEYEEYLEDLKLVFQNIYNITKEDGSLWIVIDTFKKEKSVVPLPFDLVSKLIGIGWKLKDIIIWKKDKTVPWSTKGFVQRKFEYILFFSKTDNFKYNIDRVRAYDTSHLKRWWVKYPERYNPKGKAIDEVWEYPIPTQGSWGNKYIRHFCPLPIEMVGNMIQLTTDEGDLVLDPFSGSGSVPAQACFMKRNYVGFELNKSYIDMFEDYINNSFTVERKKYNLLCENDDQSQFEITIMELRCLKYARLLRNYIKKSIDISNIIIFTEFVRKIEESNKIIDANFIVCCDHNETILKPIIDQVVKRPPLSKFGIKPSIFFHEPINKDFMSGKEMFGYTSTNSHSTFGEVNYEDLDKRCAVISPIKMMINENDYN